MRAAVASSSRSAHRQHHDTAVVGRQHAPLDHRALGGEAGGKVEAT